MGISKADLGHNTYVYRSSCTIKATEPGIISPSERFEEVVSDTMQLSFEKILKAIMLVCFIIAISAPQGAIAGGSCKPCSSDSDCDPQSKSCRYCYTSTTKKCGKYKQPSSGR